MNPCSVRLSLAAMALLLGANAIQAQITVIRVSVSSTGVEADSATPASSRPALALSADGRLVVFISSATHLVPDDTNGVDDVFVRDLATGVLERVSVSTAGAQMLGYRGIGCFCAAISGDGRYVVFTTPGTKLIDGETGSGGRHDVYLRDRLAGTTERVSVSPAGGLPNGDSGIPSISRDGRYVAFHSQATNLVAKDRNRAQDVFVRDLWTQTNVRASVDSAGCEANSASMTTTNAALTDDGLHVVFISSATNLVTGDTNGTSDVFVRDLVAGTTERVNLTSSGGQSTGAVQLGTPSISGNGHYVTYVSRAADLMPVGAPLDSSGNYWYQAFRYDRVAGTTEIVSRGPNGELADAGIVVGMLGSSADGRLVAFVSKSANLVPGFPTALAAVFVRDTVSSGVTLANPGVGGTWPDGGAFPWQAPVSADGSTVAFGSAATNHVSGDSNGLADVFVAR